VRQGQQNRRGRGRNNNTNPNRGKGHHNPLSRSFESNGPDVKIRGTPAHIAEKYLSLARDAQSTGDPVLAENYLQHAEHYNRIIMAYRDQFNQPNEGMNGGGQRMRGRNNSGGGGNNNNNQNRKGPNPLTRNYESNGPDVKIRGSAQQIAEKYAQLARDAHSSGDRVMAENYLQHAEHYNRIIAAAQAQMPIQNMQSQRDPSDDDMDDDRDEFDNNAGQGNVGQGNVSQGNVVAYYSGAPLINWRGDTPNGHVLLLDFSPQHGIRVEPQLVF